MAGQATDATPALPHALAEPTVPVRKRWIAQLGLASMGLWMASLTPLQILLPKQVQDVAHGQKFLVIGLVHALGAIAAIVATPLVGALSDRTTNSGRSAGCTGDGTAGRSAWRCWPPICLALISRSRPRSSGCVGLWALFSVFNNGQYASLSASIPDHVPVRQRATVAGWVGMPQALGLVIGVELVGLVFKGFTAGLPVPCRLHGPVRPAVRVLD